MSNILLATGDQEFLRHRFVRTVISGEVGQGRKLVYVDGSSADLDQEIESALSMSSMFDQKLIIHVVRADKIKTFSFMSMASEEALILLESKSKPKKLKLGKKFIKSFPKPPFFKLEAHAAEFFISELKSRGCQIDKKLSDFVVKSVGTDLGVLSFEALKASCLEQGEITIDILKRSLAPLSEVGPDQIILSLETQDLKRMVRSLDRFRKYQKYDPTIMLCGRFLSPLFFKWLQAVSSPYSPEETAQQLGANAWYWKNKISAPASHWGLFGVYQLNKAVSASQSSVFKGSLDPWTVLKSGLIQAQVSLRL